MKAQELAEDAIEESIFSIIKTDPPSELLVFEEVVTCGRDANGQPLIAKALDDKARGEQHAWNGTLPEVPPDSILADFLSRIGSSAAARLSIHLKDKDDELQKRHALIAQVRSVDGIIDPDVCHVRHHVVHLTTDRRGFDLLLEHEGVQEIRLMASCSVQKLRLMDVCRPYESTSNYQWKE